MEYPGSWELLTASLAVCDLAQSQVAWEFLARHGLVRNGPGDRETFVGLVRREMTRGPITGPSLARRVAIALNNVGIALPAGEVPDPWGKIAEGRLKAGAAERQR